MCFILRSTVCAAVSFLTVIPSVPAATNELSGSPPAPIIRSWGTEAGLPQNTVTAVVQSPDGYMWLGTRDDLARFDGVRFERERLRISKDMHDHVGGVLTQVSQLSDMGLNETEDKALVKKRFERIGNRARVAVQALDEIVWATNLKNDNLASFAEYVSRFSDEFFEYTNIRCWQEVPATFPALPLRAEVRHNVFLAVREAFNNALKHSKCSEVWLRIKLEEGQATVEVEDNGCGFNPAQPAAGGNGLENMRARMVEDGGQTVLISTPGKGTRIRLIFPVASRL